MPSSGDGTGWDEVLPTNSGLVSDTGLEIRDLRKGVRIRAEKEHATYGTASAGGEHKYGSAKAYYQTTTPTKRPDGTTNLGVGDGGRFLVRSDTGQLLYWDESTNAFIPIKLTDISQLGAGLIDKTVIASGFVLGIYPMAVVVDQKTSGNDGGTFASGSLRTRTLNTIQADSGSIVTSVVANQVLLSAGRYRFKATAPAHQVDQHQIVIADVSNGATIAYGQVSSAPAGVTVVTQSVAVGERNFADPVLIEVQHRCTTTKNGSGFGLAASFGLTETYTILEIFKML